MAHTSPGAHTCMGQSSASQSVRRGSHDARTQKKPERRQNIKRERIGGAGEGGKGERSDRRRATVRAKHIGPNPLSCALAPTCILFCGWTRRLVRLSLSPPLTSSPHPLSLQRTRCCSP